MTGGLQVLALTDALSRDDFQRFRSIAAGFLDQYGKDGAVLVADRKGRLLFSSLTEDSAELPMRNNRAIVEGVFASKAPQYSDLFVGAVKQRQVVTVEVPVLRDGEVIYDLCFSPPIDIFQKLIEKQRPDGQWTVSRLDTKGIVFARAPNPEETFGKRASPSLYDTMFRNPEASLSTVSLDGVALSSAYARSHLTGWTVAAGVSENSLIAPLWRNIAITGLILLGAYCADRARLCAADGNHDRTRRDAA